MENHPLQSKLQEIAEKLVAVSHNPELPVKIYVVKDQIVNAFNTGGGYIYVTSGLLEQAGSEDELAFILGHEFAHAMAAHPSRQFLPNLILNLGALLAQTISESNTADEIIATVNQYLTTGYSRRHEREADVLGTVYALKAGYKPLKGADFFIKGAKKEEQLLKEAEKSFREAEASYQIAYAKYQSNSSSLLELLIGYYSRQAKTAYESYLQARKQYLTVVNYLSPLFRSHPMNEERIATLHEVVDYLEGKQVPFSTSEAVYTLNVLVSLDRRILQKQDSERKEKINE